MMHGHEKSDSVIVAEKPANKAEQPLRSNPRRSQADLDRIKMPHRGKSDLMLANTLCLSAWLGAADAIWSTETTRFHLGARRCCRVANRVARAATRADAADRRADALP